MQIELKSYGNIERQPQGHYAGHVIHVRQLRRDGKYACSHIFGSGRKINTVQTAESLQLDIERLK